MAAFAFERDARHALTLVDATGDIDARFCMHQVANEHGGVDLVMLEARASSPHEAQRIEVLMQGAGGIVVAPDAFARVAQRWQRGSGRRPRSGPQAASTASG